MNVYLTPPIAIIINESRKSLFRIYGNNTKTVNAPSMSAEWIKLGFKSFAPPALLFVDRTIRFYRRSGRSAN